MMKYLIVSFLSAVVLSFFTHAVVAQTDSKVSLGIAPTYNDVVINESDKEKQVQFFLFNNNAQKVQATISAVDIKQQDLTGRVEYLSGNDTKNPYRLAAHIIIPQKNITLEPHKTTSVIISIRNDKDLFPGGHYAAVIASISSKSEGKKPLLIPSLTTQLYVRKVGGELPGLKLLSSDYAKHFIVLSYPRSSQLLFFNSGNIHMIPYGTVMITDMFKRQIYKGIINEPSTRIFPQTHRNIPVQYQKLTWSLPISINTGTIEGIDSLNSVTYAQNFTFLYVDYRFILGFLIVIAILFIFKKVVRNFIHRIKHSVQVVK